MFLIAKINSHTPHIIFSQTFNHLIQTHNLPPLHTCVNGLALKVRDSLDKMATFMLFGLSLASTVCSFLFMFISFTSPFWYKSWTRVHSSFSNIGLWHICLAGYIKPRDPILKSYVGCWWIHSSEFSSVRSLIMPCK